MSKVITPHFEKLIDRLLASGRFNNKSEVIRAGLRLLEEHEATTAAASRDDLSRMIQTALENPRPLIPATSLLRRRQRR
jgi:antitoxin ParD1/3/4